MEHSNQFLGTEPIGKLMTQYTVPCIISLLVGALYNIVDQLFIANDHVGFLMAERVGIKLTVPDAVKGLRVA